MSRLYRPARAIEVDIEEENGAVTLHWRGVAYHGQVLCHWRLCTNWWEETVERYCYLCHSPALTCEVYRDMVSGQWYLQRIYD